MSAARRSWTASLALGFALSGCLPPPAESTSNAAKTEGAAHEGLKPGDPAATIVGPVAYIDGKRVARIGQPVKVAPGCHVVRTDSNFVTSNSTVTVWGTITPVDFVLPTREGFNYYVERQILDTSSNRSPVRFMAYEREESGKVVQGFAPTRDAAKIRACNANAPPPVEQ